MSSTFLKNIISKLSFYVDFIPYDINNSTQTGSYINIGGTYRNWNRGIYCFEVETDSSFPIKY